MIVNRKSPPPGEERAIISLSRIAIEHLERATLHAVCAAVHVNRAAFILGISNTGGGDHMTN
jgi:hypothetical protein